jgi:hypothetical protein
MNKKRTALIAAAVVMLVIGLSGIPALASTCGDVTLINQWVTAKPVYTNTFTWGITKTAAPDTLNLYTGDSGTSKYTVTATKDSGTIAAFVQGQVYVQNGGVTTTTQGLTITATMVRTSDKQVMGSTTVDTSKMPELGPGQSYTYDYMIPVTPSSLSTSDTYKVSADITVTNHAGHCGDVWGPSPDSDGFNWPANPTPVHDSITVTDTNGQTWGPVSEGTTWTYEKTFTAADQGANTNTATATYTDDANTPIPPASATVTVNVYNLAVTKTASTSFTRSWTWSITKSVDNKQVDPTKMTLATGQSLPAYYTVTPSAKSADSNWQATGTITATAPTGAPDATINSAKDIVSLTGSNDIPANVVWGVSFPYTLKAGDTLTGTYSVSLPDASARTNTATVTLQNYNYASDGTTKTAIGTTDFSGQASVVFTDTPTKTVDQQANLGDSSPFWQVLYSANPIDATQLPVVWTYTHDIGPYSAPGTYTVTNTATFTTSDTKTTGSAQATVTVTVPSSGCTRTPGYWKTHSSLGPVKPDPTWAKIQPLGENTPFFSSGQTWVQVEQIPSGNGNPYYILSYQYIAAKLNMAAGAGTTPAVDAALASANSFFLTHTPAQGATLKATDKAAVTNLATLLANYNLGVTGPGHCSE